MFNCAVKEKSPQNLARAGTKQPPQPQEYAELAVNIDIDTSEELVRVRISDEMLRFSHNLIFVADPRGFACEKATGATRVLCPVVIWEAENVLV